MGFEEKRRYKRLDLAGHIKIEKLSFSNSTKIVNGKFKNVSEGGILFETKENIEKGTFLKIIFSIPENKALAAKYKEFINVNGKTTVIIGKVVRSIKVEDKWQLGIQFVNMYEGDFANLQHFLKIIEKNYSW